MSNIQIIYICISVLITSLIWFIIFSKIKGKYDNLNSNLDKELIIKSDNNTKSLQNKINDLIASIPDLKAKSYDEGYDKAKSEFSIQVFPYKDEFKKGNDGIFINDIYHEVSIGYQYQLFVKGIPVLQPAIIIEETLVENKRYVDFEKIEDVINLVESKLKPMIENSNGIMKLVSSIKK